MTSTLDVKFSFERWADGLKVLGAGNGTGLLATTAGLHYLSANTHILIELRLSAAAFFSGIILFAFSFLVFTANAVRLGLHNESADAVLKINELAGLSEPKLDYFRSNFKIINVGS